MMDDARFERDEKLQEKGSVSEVSSVADYVLEAQIKAEEEHSIQYRTCSWQKVSV